MIVQMTSVDSLEINLKKILGILESLGTEVEWVFFPENCLYLRIKEGDDLYLSKLSDPYFKDLSSICVKKNVNVHFGSVACIIDKEVFNSSVVITCDGNVRVTYDKIHLFDIDLENQRSIRESDVFARGRSLSCLGYKDWLIGQTICYDLRFSDLYLAYARLGVDVLLVPSSFLKQTGEAHWHSLLRARAIESQAYIIASAQSGPHVSVRHHGLSRLTFGHSIVVDPWGEVLVDLNQGESNYILTIDKEKIEKVRKQIPMSKHRISDLGSLNSTLIQL